MISDSSTQMSVESKTHIHAQRQSDTQRSQGRVTTVSLPDTHHCAEFHYIGHCYYTQSSTRRVGIRWILPALKVYYLPYITIRLLSNLAQLFYFPSIAFGPIILRRTYHFDTCARQPLFPRQERNIDAHLMGVRTVFHGSQSSFGLKTRLVYSPTSLMEAALRTWMQSYVFRTLGTSG